MRRAASGLSVLILLTAYLLIGDDDLYGPKDDILYLWIFSVLLLMTCATCILLYQVGTYVFRWARARGQW